MKKRFVLLLALVIPALALQVDDPSPLLNKTLDGYRGIWYFNGNLKDNESVYKYSGGLGTYPANHYPFSVYVPKVNKTFFCYGGTDSTGQTLFHMASYYDHKTGMVPKPTLLLDKKTEDAHDNPVMNVDDKGYIWIFSTSHGTSRPSYIHRSKKPYDVSAFERINATRLKQGKEVPFDNFSYLQSWYQPGQGFMHLMTLYHIDTLETYRKNIRATYYITSRDGVHWGEPQRIAAIQEGHYQTSGQFGKKIATSFNYHPVMPPPKNGLDYRTNLYYIATDDFGKNWKAADGTPVSLPLRDVTNPGLVRDYKREGLNVYISDLAFDSKGNPAILYVTSKGPEPGPQSGPHVWWLARFNAGKWAIDSVTTSDHNYDMGSLYTESDALWRIIGPSEKGPQPYGTGGELTILESRDQGRHWTKTKNLTQNSQYNQAYPRRSSRSHPGFYAFWADGHSRQPSPSSLYFCNQAGEVFQLPRQMKAAQEKPRKVN